MLSDLDVVYCCSQFIQRRFLEDVADDSGKTIVVYNGIAANPPSPKQRIFAFGFPSHDCSSTECGRWGNVGQPSIWPGLLSSI